MKTAVLGVSLIVMNGCIGTFKKASAPVENRPAGSPTTAVASLSQKERFRAAIDYLEQGQPRQAQDMLKAYLKESPRSTNAKDLLAQITTPSKDYFPERYITVNLASGQSLSTLSRQYLGSAFKFYALAKYNNISNPSKVNIGQSINIPLTASTQAYLKKQEQKRQAEVARAKAEAEKKSQELAKQKEALEKQKAMEAAPEEPEVVEPELTPSLLMTQLTQLVASSEYATAVKKLEHLKSFGELNRDARQLAISALVGHGHELADTDKLMASDRFTEAGQFELNNGDNMAALANFTLAAELDPGNEVALEDKMLLQREIADKYHREASSAFRRQELDMAIAGWNKVLEVDPEHSSARVYLQQAIELQDRLRKLNN